MTKDPLNRRDFLKKSTVAGLGLTVFAQARGMRGQEAPSNQVRLAVCGTNSRGASLAGHLTEVPGVQISHICDPDRRAVQKGIETVTDNGRRQAPTGLTDFRRVLDDPEVDGLVIATPDHWHAPMTLMAVQAGKHVYVEKPCSHNPREGELLTHAMQKYPNLVIQMGNQRRSAGRIIEIVNRIHDGLIGKPYLGKAWYSRKRDGIGHGKVAPVPDWLDYELWQGPAPRTPYRDNIIHYNWHWFWRWGTGEINNNGTHEIDLCRWALGVDFPTKVTSVGGRYAYDDDWEFYDSQNVGYEFGDNAMITWEGRSADDYEFDGDGRAALVVGTEGSVKLETKTWKLYDNGGNLVEESGGKAASDVTNTVSPDTKLDTQHLANFVEAVRGETQQTSPIDEGAKTSLLCHLGNIAQHVGRTLECNPIDGHIVNDAEAQAMWGRTYEPGWEPTV